MWPYGIAIIGLAAALLVLAGAVVVLLTRRGPDRQAEAVQALQQQVLATTSGQEQRWGQFSQQVNQTLHNLTTQINERLHQTQTLNQETQKAIAQRLEAAGKTMGDLQGQLGQLNQATRQIAQVGSEVRALQDILQSPKLRGNLGEWSLENLLADVLPKAHYELQHRFRNGHQVDALVRLAQGSVCIDAKFPLPNFRVMLEAADEAARTKARRQFLRDVTARIDEIADRYIVPEEGTLDFALMYVPAENVYYETMLTTPGQVDIGEYGRGRKVMLVSPNTLYAYLMAIATGLRGLQIEKNAQALRQRLSQWANELGLFAADFQRAGKHLANARAKYDEATQRLERLTARLGDLEGREATEADDEPA